MSRRKRSESVPQAEANFMAAQAAEDRQKAQIEVFEEQFKRATGELSLHAKVVLKDKSVERQLASIRACHELAMEIRDCCNRVIRTSVEAEG
ncbi:MAG: hypothetical protein IT458_08415 [Planctomycetes bacterium]|nr:hypothetical protein [Planctomycetota bacterium]